MKNNKILIIIPAYNEEENIEKTVNEIEKYTKNKKIKIDVIVINDGSADNTEEILCKNNIPHITLINNLGIGGAVQTGYKYAYENNYDIAVQYDADGQHDIKYIEDIINPIIDEQYDCVIGSRFIDNKLEGFKSTKTRRMGINLISAAIKLRTHKKIYDTTSGFRASGKEVIKLFANNYPTEYPEPITNMILLKEKFKVKEVPVIMRERAAGQSSIRSWKNIYYMVNVLLSILLISYKGGKINE